MIKRARESASLKFRLQPVLSWSKTASSRDSNGELHNGDRSDLDGTEDPLRLGGG